MRRAHIMRALALLATLAAAFRTPTHRVTARKPDKKAPQTVAPILVAASTAVPVDPAPPKRRALRGMFVPLKPSDKTSGRQPQICFLNRIRVVYLLDKFVNPRLAIASRLVRLGAASSFCL